MSSSHGEPYSASLASLEAMVGANLSGQVEGDRHEQGKQQLLAALGHRRAGLGQQLRRVALLVAVLCSLGAAAYIWQQRSQVSLTYDIAGGVLSDSGYMYSSGPTGVRLSFSDGSRIELQQGARARIASVAAHGARLIIENGHATLNLAHLPRADWYVDAGPFALQISGTQLEVDWSSSDDTLSVDVHEGRLSASGPPAPNGVLVRAGQRLTAHEGGLSIEAIEQSAQIAGSRSILGDSLLPDPANANANANANAPDRP